MNDLLGGSILIWKPLALAEGPVTLLRSGPVESAELTPRGIPGVYEAPVSDAMQKAAHGI